MYRRLYLARVRSAKGSSACLMGTCNLEEKDMTYKAERFLDAFTFALGGASIASSFAAMPIVANDRIAKAWAARLTGAEDTAPAPRNGGRLASILLQFAPRRRAA